MCIAPIVLLGYMLTMYPNPSHVTDKSGTYIEYQTCDTGIGLHGKVVTSGLYGIGLHYGFKVWEQDKWSMILQPKVGLSYSSSKVYELPSQGQFEVGLGLLWSYDRLLIGLEYWHLSNAGLQQPNIGLDMIGTTIGWQF